jgi:hypothetical protein
VHPSRSEHVIPYLEWVCAEALGQTELAFDELVNQFNAAQNTPGLKKRLKPSIGATRLFILRWSCSTTLFK